MCKQKEHYIYMDLLRVISAFAVIVIHVSGANWSKIDMHSSDWMGRMIFNLFGRFSVCVFCMITGFLAAGLKKIPYVNKIVS